MRGVETDARLWKNWVQNEPVKLISGLYRFMSMTTGWVPFTECFKRLLQILSEKRGFECFVLLRSVILTNVYGLSKPPGSTLFQCSTLTMLCPFWANLKTDDRELLHPLRLKCRRDSTKKYVFTGRQHTSDVGHRWTSHLFFRGQHNCYGVKTSI